MKKNNTRGRVTKRTCNLDDCGRVFDAVDDMHSCPSCNKRKNYSGGDCISGGLDEFGLGYIGGINK